MLLDYACEPPQDGVVGGPNHRPEPFLSSPIVHLHLIEVVLVDVVIAIVVVVVIIVVVQVGQDIGGRVGRDEHEADEVGYGEAVFGEHVSGCIGGIHPSRHQNGNATSDSVVRFAIALQISSQR